MAVTNDVFDLIKAMTAQEKRYYKLQAQAYTKNKGEHKLLELFNAYERRAVASSDTELRAAFVTPPSANQLASIKYELYKQLLNSLALFHREKSVDAELRSALAHIEILYNKGLYKQCAKIVKRARRKAEAVERFITLAEVLAWERKLLLRRTSSNFQQALRQFHNEQIQVLEQFALTIRYEELADQVQEAHRSHVRLQDQSAQAELKEILSSEMLNAQIEELPFHARLHVLQIRGNSDWFSGQPTAAMQWYRQAIATWEAHPAQIKSDPDNYKRYLTNFLSSAIATRAFDDFTETLPKIKAMPSASIEAAATVFSVVSYLELIFYLNNGELQTARARVAEFEAALPKYLGRLRPDRLINLHYNCSTICFLCGDYGAALEHINHIFGVQDAEPKRDIQDFTWLFRLVIHYELGDYTTLENLVRVTQRYLNSRERQDGYEKTVLAAIRRLLNAADSAARSKVLGKLQETLIKHLHDDDEQDPLGLIELIFWLESKLQLKAINKIYADKMQASQGVDRRELFK